MKDEGRSQEKCSSGRDLEEASVAFPAGRLRKEGFGSETSEGGSCLIPEEQKTKGPLAGGGRNGAEGWRAEPLNVILRNVKNC